MFWLGRYGCAVPVHDNRGLCWSATDGSIEGGGHINMRRTNPRARDEGTGQRSSPPPIAHTTYGTRLGERRQGSSRSRRRNAPSSTTTEIFDDQEGQHRIRPTRQRIAAAIGGRPAVIREQRLML